MKNITQLKNQNIAGIDEGGRGPMHWAVVAVALIWGEKPMIDGIKDSKKISRKKRKILYKEIMNNAKDIGVGVVHETQIDEINILQSTYLAMRKQWKIINKTRFIFIDGNRADIKHIKQKNIIKGDSLSYTIACASIIAKVTRDKLMIEYANIFPEYNFDKHKVMGQISFRNDKKYRSTPIHRKSFKPISPYLPKVRF